MFDPYIHILVSVVKLHIPAQHRYKRMLIYPGEGFYPLVVKSLIKHAKIVCQ